MHNFVFIEERNSNVNYAARATNDQHEREQFSPDLY